MTVTYKETPVRKCKQKRFKELLRSKRLAKCSVKYLYCKNYSSEQIVTFILLRSTSVSSKFGDDLVSLTNINLRIYNSSVIKRNKCYDML